MGIVKPRDHHTPLQVDSPNRRVSIAKLVPTDRCDPSVFDHDRFAYRECIVDSYDLAIVEDQIGRCVLCPQT